MLISEPPKFLDSDYWGFDGEGAQEAAKTHGRLVDQTNKRLLDLGKRSMRDLTKALEASGGVEDARVRAVVAAIVADNRAFARLEWRDLAESLQSYADVDLVPNASRVGTAYGLSWLYKQFASMAVYPAEADLRVLYRQLADKVYTYFERV